MVELFSRSGCEIRDHHAVVRLPTTARQTKNGRAIACSAVFEFVTVKSADYLPADLPLAPLATLAFAVVALAAGLAALVLAFVLLLAVAFVAVDLAAPALALVDLVAVAFVVLLAVDVTVGVTIAAAPMLATEVLVAVDLRAIPWLLQLGYVLKGVKATSYPIWNAAIK